MEVITGVKTAICEALHKSVGSRTDGVFVKGGLTISGESLMPEGCMDCKLQNRCLCIPPDLSADEVSELYISRRPNCPLSMIAEPKTGEWIWKDRHIKRTRQVKGLTVNGEETVVNVHEDYIEQRPYCSECGKWNDSDYLGFCPNCGAMMNGGKEE